jgi:predicted HicB family RNase H-like nuclease
MSSCDAKSRVPERTNPHSYASPSDGAIRVSSSWPESHGAALVAAQASDKGLNQWAIEVVQGATDT